jgi:ribosome-associated protein
VDSSRLRLATSIQLRGEHITLSQAVKVAGLAGSGGQAKIIIRAGEVHVNGETETRPGRKLRAGDRFMLGEDEWVIES